MLSAGVILRIEVNCELSAAQFLDAEEMNILTFWKRHIWVVNYSIQGK
jgi:hypothetical protein